MSAPGFSFIHGERTFTCCVETSRTSARGSWWWFAVSTEAHQRHAPFPATPDDTQDDVRKRIISFYETMLARRAEPYQHRRQFRTQPSANATTATTAATATSATSDSPTTT